MNRKRHWRPRSLGKRLMVGVSSLVIVVVLTVGALSVYALRSYMLAVSDVEVMHSLASFQHSVSTGPRDGPLADFTGQASGTIIAVMQDRRIVQSAMFDDSGPRQVPADAIARLAKTTATGDRPQTMDIDDVGVYRVAASDIGDGTRLLSAVSLESATEQIAAKTAAVIAITMVAAVVAAAGTVAIVRHALRPLRRVADAASKAASTVALVDGDQRVTAHIVDVDLDSTSEVGVVAETLNRLLDNVDAAFAARTESDRRMRRFLTDASHELRTPLAAIRGYAELTRQDGPMLPDTTEYALARIEAESRRMTSLVDDMLLLSRLDERRGLEHDRLDLCALVVDAVNDVAVTAPDHHFTVDLPDDAVWVNGDRARLHQVVSNLLSNASTHTPAGVTVTTTIRLPPDTAEGGIDLSICDDGPGIDESLMPEIFDRFVRADNSRSHEHHSTGLGLSIVASITEAHGGTVEATSQLGATCFRIRLPAGDQAKYRRADVSHDVTDVRGEHPSMLGVTEVKPGSEDRD